ncbi:alpha-galactosidase [Paludicola sp. MB14-C6]|uniref:alpha-galactosidase n=1 Tax=Paludihabitans sp. MB14-C6 TaxID=3070656 RepID=UPI0027DB9EDA|nr:alpha-galactosidase [Paludicola sp. MB14-C6]WMJ24035.1 alpha-galactosidase [Paludicola sp. MB14-C6]
MIQANETTFRLDTANSTYLFRKTKYGHLEHIYYGTLLADFDDVDVLAQKRTIQVGSSVLYDESDSVYSLDSICLEWSDNGRGDYRQSPTELKMPDGSFVSDFIYVGYKIVENCVTMKTLPTAYGEAETLIVTLKDTTNELYVDLYYSVFAEANVITRRAVLRNETDVMITIRRMMSMALDLPDENFQMYTLDGGWIKEANIHKHPISYGIVTNSSTTGASSNRHNPAFLLAEANANEEYGNVYAFNLVYSGNHYSAVEKNERDYVRILMGINPHCFDWKLASKEQFETPECVMTYSNRGLNGMSHQFHNFINNNIVRGNWKKKERPILLNNWEAHFFDFNEHKLLQLAKQAKELGVELFVLDDGWFGERNTDKAGLGDYTVNTKKLPQGMKAFASKIKALGLDFGLWFEPEMVNSDSELYRAHPDYAVKLPSKQAVLGRNQFVLDLCQEEVRDYIVKQVGSILDEANISYVKWDMNRHIAEAFSTAIENQGEFYHRYIIGLYEVLERIFCPRPHILLESCSSGGNRFDLGMLCFSPQIWSSDDTDPIERLKIQAGLSYFYPLSTMGAHVSQSPHQQTLRDTPLATRFHVASFGCLGYELDLKYLSPEEKKDITEQIAFYKQYRNVFQYGKFSRMKTYKSNKVMWQCISEDRKTALTGLFQTLATAAESSDKLNVTGLEKGKYAVHTRPQRLYIERFGGLMKHVLPVELNPDGMILHVANRHYSLRDCIESYICSDNALRAGIPLCEQFIGTGYNEKIRMLGDFGSNLYIAEKINEED